VLNSEFFMVNVQNIHSLTEFKRNANSYIETIRSTKAPIVITVNGEAAVVVQDAIEYQALIDRSQARDAEMREMKLEALRKEIQVGVDQIKAGEYTEYTEYTEETLTEFFDDIVSQGREKLGLMR
jgi:prevent-host-death family protein